MKRNLQTPPSKPFQLPPQSDSDCILLGDSKASSSHVKTVTTIHPALPRTSNRSISYTQNFLQYRQQEALTIRKRFDTTQLDTVRVRQVLYYFLIFLYSF